MTDAAPTTAGRARNPAGGRAPAPPWRPPGAAAALLLAAGALAAVPVAAETLRIGLSFEPTARDPHFHPTTANESLALHVYDRLLVTDELENLRPGLAESWRIIDPLTWEFTLRHGVTFHDGTPLTAEDVVFSAARACCVPNQPFSLGTYIRGKTFTRIDDHTLRVTTTTPAATMLSDLSRFSIVSRRSGERSTAEYNAGQGSPGTGPYRVVGYVPGDRITLEANPGWWAGPPRWERVVIRPITSGASRLAGLLAGELDLIDAVPPADVARLRASGATAVSQGVSNRLIYLHMDSFRTDATPFARAADGSALSENPLRQREVRRALSRAINRAAIVERVMDGLAVPTGQFVAEGMFGYDPGLAPEPFDPEGARALLAAAGYPHGFRITLHAPNNRLVNDEKVAQSIAQMLTRAGVRTEVEAMPSTMFFSRAGRYEFSLFLSGWGTIDLANATLRSLLAAPDRERGLGSSNRGRYSNPEIDALVQEANRTVDPDQRAAILRRATAIAVEDAAIIPLYHQVNAWGTRRGLAYRARSDENTLAESAVRE